MLKNLAFDKFDYR